MHGMKEIILEASSLPVEERAIVVDSLIRTLNSPIDGEIEKEWIKVARRRLTELRSGRAEAIPGEEVFAQIKERFEK